MLVPAKEPTLTTKTQRVIDDVTAQIKAGTLHPGDKLPSAREMRERYNVSQMTVRMAIERLRSAGWIVTVPGAGAWVSGNPPTT